MPGLDETKQFVPLKIAVLTISDTRSLKDDKSGALLEHAREQIRDLKPVDDGQRWLLGQALDINTSLLRQRWLLIEQSGPAVHGVVLVILGIAGISVAPLLEAASVLILGPMLLVSSVIQLLVGFFAAFVMICAQVLVQEETPHELLGRVSSTLWSLLSIAQVTAMLAAGPVADRFGVVDLYYFSAAVLMVIGVYGYWKLQRGKRA